MKIQWSRQAEMDLLAILEYLADDDWETAVRMERKFHEAADSLKRFPLRGSAGKLPGTRELLVGKRYRLVYEVADDYVTILGLWHTSRQYPPLHGFRPPEKFPC